jgi:uncharacterized protein (DUF849 family)/N-acetylglutamate synthase-like GNAT family acetyltransferase
VSEAGSGFRIRYARPGDRPRIVDLLRAGGPNPGPAPAAGVLDDPGLLVMEQDGALLGAAGYAFRSAEVGETTLLAVRPDASLLGLDLKLHTRCMQIMRSLGCENLAVHSDRPDTSAWYQRHFGYAVAATLPGRPRAGQGAGTGLPVVKTDLTDIPASSPTARKLLINAAITGMKHRKSSNPRLPVTPAEIAATALEAGRLGAAIVHLHARGSDEEPTPDAAVYADIIGRIRAENPDLILCVTTSGRHWPELAKRAAVLDLREDAKPDMASLTLGSMNFATEASVNSPEVIQALALHMRERGIKPELEIFDVGMLDYAKYLIRHGTLRQPAYFNLIVGSLGTLNATPGHLAYLVAQLPADATWAASGIGRSHRKVQAWAAEMGGGLRTGLEDSLFLDLDNRVPASNGDWIRRAVDLAARQGRELATPGEVRHWLELDTP